MNKEYEQLTVKLTSLFSDESIKFITELLEKTNDGLDTSDLINLVMSAHFSSMFTMMKELSKPHPEMNEKVIVFIENVTSSLKKIKPIEDVYNF